MSNKCPVCHSRKIKSYLNTNDHHLLICKHCDLVYLEEIPAESETRKYFENEYITTPQDVDETFARRRINALRQIRELAAPYLDTKSRLLDIGSASGFFIGIAKEKYNWNFYAAEPSRYASKVCSNRYSVPVYQGFVTDPAFQYKGFDAVFFLDGLYFVSDPVPYAKKISEISNPGSFLFVELPGFRYRMLKGSSFLGKLFYGPRLGIQLGLHNYYFRRKNLEKLFGAEGYQLVNTHPIEGPIYGNTFRKFLLRLTSIIMSGLYNIAGGRVSISPKELYIFRKN